MVCLGDNKVRDMTAAATGAVVTPLQASVRVKARSSVLVFSEMVGSALVFERLRKLGTHKSWRVREQVLACYSCGVLDHGFDFVQHQPWLELVRVCTNILLIYGGLCYVCWVIARVYARPKLLEQSLTFAPGCRRFVQQAIKCTTDAHQPVRDASVCVLQLIVQHTGPRTLVRVSLWKNMRTCRGGGRRLSALLLLLMHGI